MKKIYITGIAGLLGGNIAFLLRDKYQIYGCDRNQMNMNGVRLLQTDLVNDFEALTADIMEIRPDVIINTVAFVNVDGCESDPDLAEYMNAEIPKKLLQISKQVSAHLIQISTDAVYKDIPGLHTEGTQVNPLNVYSATKLGGEMWITGYDYGTIIRTNIYGFNVRSKFSFGEWILDSLLNHKSLNMVDDINFSPILVNDLILVLQEIIEKQIYGLYNVCGTGSITKYEFGIFLDQVFGFKNSEIHKINSDALKLTAPRNHNMSMSNDKVTRKLGMTLRTPKESIIEFYRLYQDGYGKKLKEFGGNIDGDKNRE